jgi:ubiquinone/menaquinone biosynthesis C-methylase UbiE
VTSCEDDAMGSPNVDLGFYYRERAGEYDEVYAKPERQTDIAVLKSLLPDLVAGMCVLEVAAGTGYWTEALSVSAKRILATDLNPETLAVARRRRYDCPVEFAIADAYRLGSPDGSFDTAFVGFWWSHVARRNLPRFLASLHRRLGPDRRVILLDNRYVEGSNHPITRTDNDGKPLPASTPRQRDPPRGAEELPE